LRRVGPPPLSRRAQQLPQRPGEVRGIYFWDLVFSYADFDVNQNNVRTHGQAFKISYKVNF
jgi:hypothetical protein